METASDERICFSSAKRLFEQGNSTSSNSQPVSNGKANWNRSKTESSNSIGHIPKSQSQQDVTSFASLTLEKKPQTSNNKPPENKSTPQQNPAKPDQRQPPALTEPTQMSSSSKTTLTSSKSFDTIDSGSSSAKPKFIVQNKRGDTSDLRWLNSVQFSKGPVSASSKAPSSIPTTSFKVPSSTSTFAKAPLSSSSSNSATQPPTVALTDWNKGRGEQDKNRTKQATITNTTPQSSGGTENVGNTGGDTGNGSTDSNTSTSYKSITLNNNPARIQGRENGSRQPNALKSNLFPLVSFIGQPASINGQQMTVNGQNSTSTLKAQTFQPRAEPMKSTGMPGLSAEMKSELLSAAIKKSRSADLIEVEGIEGKRETVKMTVIMSSNNNNQANRNNVTAQVQNVLPVEKRVIEKTEVKSENYARAKNLSKNEIRISAVEESGSRTQSQLTDERDGRVTGMPPTKNGGPVGDREVVTASDRVAQLYLSEKSTETSPEVRTDVDLADDDLISERITLNQWDPTKMLKEIYQVKLREDTDYASNYINKEGYMEKLPVSKTKDTFLKTWKRRFFRAYDGILHYFESVDDKQETGSFQLNGGKVEEIGARMLGIEDGRGHYLILRCLSDKDFADWKRVLESQTVDSIQSTWIKPVLKSSPCASKKVIVLEIGSWSIRAGILGDRPSLPDLFLPTIVAVDRETGKRNLCFDALRPDVRASSVISYPVRPTTKVDKYSIDWDSIPELFQLVFRQLNVDPSQYCIMFSVPTSFNEKIKTRFMNLFVNQLNVGAVYMASQAILALYSYSATSGVVVDIGDRIEILPVTDGYVADGGIARVPFGGQKILESFNTSLIEQRYRFSTDVEFQIVRMVMEKLCFVSTDIEMDSSTALQCPEQFHASVPLHDYNLPSDTWDEISASCGRFQSPEGLFDMGVWGLDNPSLPKMIQKAVMACPMDSRRQMWRSIYLSGGVTQLEGFSQRLQTELSALAPSTVAVQVHASPNRYHASYIGACALAGMAAFEDGCILANEWRQHGVACFAKWKSY